MIKYVDTLISFAEVPDEITLAISISNCPGTCKGCHSPWLREDIGEPLTVITLYELLEKNKGVSCVCFMGGDNDTEHLKLLFKWVKENYPNIKTAWYSGSEYLKDKTMTGYLDYLKLGSYKEGFGPLNSRTTNQRMYKVHDCELEDITSKFWK